jgi:Protein of unknown function (DUF3096)
MVRLIYFKGLKRHAGRINKTQHRRIFMTLHLELAPLISLGAGIGILVFPKLLNYIVAGYLIAMGVLGLVGHSF